MNFATIIDTDITISTSGTALEGTDYGNVADITISAGDTTGTATFTPTDDSVYEGNETATITMASITGANAGSTTSQTITITENERAPTVTLSTSATSIAENAGSSLMIPPSVVNIKFG